MADGSFRRLGALCGLSNTSGGNRDNKPMVTLGGGGRPARIVNVVMNSYSVIFSRRCNDVIDKRGVILGVGRTSGVLSTSNCGVEGGRGWM